MATKTDILHIRLERSGDGHVKASIAGVSDEFGKLDKKTKETQKSALSLRSVLTTLAGAAGIKSTISTIVTFERLSASLKTVTGSAKAADAAFSGLKQFATETPFQLEEVVDSFIKLKALGLDPSEAALRSYGNTASAMGKNLNQFIEAVADASTGEFERLKEFGIKARQQADTVSFTFQGVTTTVGKNAAEIEGFLRNIGETQFAGAMQEQMDTLGGAFSNLQDSTAQLMASIGEAGLSSFLKNVSSVFTDLATTITTVINPTEQAAASASKLGAVYKVLAFSVFKLRQEFIDFGDWLGAWAAVAGSIGPGFLDAFDTISKEREAKRAELEKDTVEFVKILNGLGSDITANIKQTTAAINNQGSALKKSRDEMKHYLQSWSDAEKLTRDARTPLEEYSDTLLNLNGRFQAGFISIETYARQIAIARESFENLTEETKEATAAQQGFIDLMAEGERVTLAMRTPIEALSDDIFRLNGLFQSGAIGVETYERAMLDAQQRFVDESQQMAINWSDAWTHAADRFAAGVGDAVAEAIVEQQNFAGAMQALLKGVVKQIISSLVEIAIKKALLTATATATMGTITAASAASAAATSAAWATPAALTSLASFGSNSIPAQAGIASTVALTEGFAIAGAAKDGLDDIPTDGSYVLHRGEMVLNEGNARELRGILSDARSGRDSAGGGGPTANINIYAIDGRSVQQVIIQQSQTIENIMQRAWNRRGKPGPLG